MGPDYTAVLGALASNNVIVAIKELRAITSLGLKEAKEVIDHVRRFSPLDWEAKLDEALATYPEVPEVPEYILLPEYTLQPVDDYTPAERATTNSLGEIVALLRETNELLKDLIEGEKP